MSKFDVENLSEDKMRRILHGLEIAKTPIVMFDNGKVIYANTTWRTASKHMYANMRKGLSIEEALLKEIKTVLPEMTAGQQKIRAKKFSKAIYAGKEVEYSRRDGRMFKGFYTADGTGLISSFSFDFTELRQKRLEAKETKKLLETTLDGLKHGVLLNDLNGVVIYANESFLTLTKQFGIKVERGMLNQGLTSQLPKHFQTQITEQGSPTDFEYVQRIPDGRSLMVEGRFLKGTGTLFSIVDITELQGAIENAKAADKAKTTFLANMSHEIRTPMNGVLGMAQILEQMDINDDQRNCTRIIKESSQMLLKIINDILDISKLDADKIELELGPFDLAETVKDALDIIRPETTAKGLELLLDAPLDISRTYYGDAGRIRQIILNLLGNAVKFTANGFIKVSVRNEMASDNTEFISIEVQDTGVGITNDKIDVIFERFEQSDNSTTRQYGGTGLGLAITKKLVTLMDGDISVSSKFGHGSTFRMSLPLNKIESNDLHLKTQAFQSFQAMPVLVIDDLPVNHLVFENQLKPLKVKPYFVHSGEQGIKFLQEAASQNIKIPLVICDFVMPTMSGLEFVKALRSYPNISETPVIIISSANILSQRKKLIALRVNHIHEKPCSTPDLLKSVSAILSRSGPLQEHGKKTTAATKLTAPKTKLILVADDDPVNQEVFKGLLELSNYQAVVVDNGLKAVKAYSEQRFDLVLMDISMPVLNGMEATKRIRTYESNIGLSHTPIVAITAHALLGDKERFIESGMDDYIAKPVLRKDFDIIVEKWISKKSWKIPAMTGLKK